MTDGPVCLRASCGHTDAEHDCWFCWCNECACTGFVSEETFEAVPEVEELHLGEEGS